MTRAAGSLAALAVALAAGLAVAQGDGRRWPLSAGDRLALEALDARERALDAERRAFAGEVARRLGIAPEALRLDRQAGAWVEAVAPVASR